MRRPRVLLLVLAVAIVAPAAIFYGLVRTPWFAHRSAGWLTAALGWPVRVDSLAAGYYPEPWLEAQGIAVATGPGEHAGTLLDIGRARIELPWRTLLGRDTHVDRLELQAPVAHLAVDAAGRDNWTGFVDHVRTLRTTGPFTWTLSSLHVERGGADYRDARSGAAAELTGLIVEVHDFRPGAFFPLELRVAGLAEPHTFHVVFKGEASLDVDHSVYAARRLHYSGWIGGGDLPLAGVTLAADLGTTRLDLTTGTAALDDLQFDGLGLHARGQLRAESLGGQPVVHFALQTDPFHPRRVGLELNSPLPATADPEAFNRASLTLQGRWDTSGFSVDPLDGELDDSGFSGSFAVPADGPPRLRLQVDRIDLDRYRAPAAKPASSPGAVLKGLLDPVMALDADVVVTVGEARAAGAVARELRVTLEPDAHAGSGNPPR